MLGDNGRPSKYKEEYDRMAYRHALLGGTDKDIADLFEVTETTVNNWKISYPSFFESIKKGKADADGVVAERLFKRATGYSHEEDKIFNNDGVPMVVPTTKHYPPDTAAAIFWLKNRQKDKWRDKIETELTGKDGGAIEHKVDLTLIPLEEIEKELKKLEGM